MFTKKLFLLLFISALMLALPISSSAIANSETNAFRIIEIPEDFNYYVSDYGTEHLYYKQAAANDNGYFAICSPHLDTENLTEETFIKQYIDIYYPDGTFWKELSFYTQFDYTFELTNETVNIYFYSWVISCGLFDNTVICYSTPEQFAMDSGLFETLRREEFTSGEWTYQCQKTMYDYTKLIRSNGVYEEIVIDMPGQGMRSYGSVFGGILAAAIALLAICLIVKAHRKKV